MNEINWNDWILQKNAEFTLDKLGVSRQDMIEYLEKKVREPAIGSENLYESGVSDEGSAKGAKWKGSDPRHDEEGGRLEGRSRTRKGGNISTSSMGQRGKKSSTRAATSGVSQFGARRLDPSNPSKKVNLKDSTTKYLYDNE